jgi:hypothetical protein
MLCLAAIAWAVTALPATAQPPDETPGKPSRSRDVETFYKIMHQTRHIGHARMVVTRHRDAGDPAVQILIESSYRNPETRLPASERIDALLKASDLSVLKYRYIADVTQPPFGRVEMTVTCEKTADMKWSVVHQGPGGRIPLGEITSDKPLVPEAGIFFLVSSREQLKRDGGVLPVRIFNPMQMDRPYLDIEVEVLPPEKRPYDGKDVSVHPYRWKRPGLLPKTVITATEYVNESATLQEAKRIQTGAVVPIVMVRTATEEASLPQGRRLVKRRGRRDPFDIAKVLTPKEKEAPPGKTPEGKPKPGTGAQLTKLLDQAAQIVTKAEAEYKQFGDIAKARIRKLYDEFLDIVLSLHNNKAMTEVQTEEMNRLRGRFERIYPGALAIIEQGKKKVEDARKALVSMARLPVAEQKYEAIEKMLSDIKSLGSSRELLGTGHEKTFQEQVLGDIETLEKRVASHKEFQKIKLEVTGIVYHLVESPLPVAAGARVLGQDLRVTGTIPLYASKSGAIINGVPLLEGEVLDLKGNHDPKLKPEDGVLVLKVLMNEVVFRFQGEEIPIPIQEPLQGTEQDAKKQPGQK